MTKFKVSKCQSVRSFTLIELLIVVSMVAMIGLAVYTTFASGLKVWKRVQAEPFEEKMVIAFDKFSHDLHNAFTFTGIKFAGRKDSLTFAAVVVSRGFDFMPIGKVSYVFDPAANSLLRSQADMAEIFVDHSPNDTVIIDNIVTAEFAYLRLDAATNNYIWVDDWALPALPLAVRLQVEYEHEPENLIFTKTVDIPVGA